MDDRRPGPSGNTFLTSVQSTLLFNAHVATTTSWPASSVFSIIFDSADGCLACVFPVKVRSVLTPGNEILVLGTRIVVPNSSRGARRDTVTRRSERLPSCGSKTSTSWWLVGATSWCCAVDDACECAEDGEDEML